MKTTYSAAEARNDFSKILSLVAFSGQPVVVERYGEPLVKVIPAKKNRLKKDFKKLINKYHGMWAKKSWAKDIGKSSRYFRKRSTVNT